MSSTGSARPVTALPVEGRERDELVAMLKAIRQEGVPKVIHMMRLLEHEATEAKRDTARVAATRAHMRLTFESAQLLHEIEQGTENQPRSGPAVQIMVAMPSGESRAPNGQELKSILADISDSVRAEITDGDEQV